jgi:hypothetical protein
MGGAEVGDQRREVGRREIDGQRHPQHAGELVAQLAQSLVREPRLFYDAPTRSK